MPLPAKRIATLSHRFRMPYLSGFPSLPNGSLPAPWIGPTFTVASGAVVNTPALGDELLADPGLEAAYTAGKCNTLAKGGAPTLAQSADTHGGAKAQQFTASAFLDYLYANGPAAVTGGVYLFSIWGKITAGTQGNIRISAGSTALPSTQAAIPLKGASYTKAQVSFISTDEGVLYPYVALEFGAADFATCIIDDMSLKLLTDSSLFALLPSCSRLVTVRAQPSALVDGSISGVVAWATSQVNPTDCLLAYWQYDTTGAKINVGLLKKKGTTWTAVIAVTALTVVSEAWVEIRPVDNATVSLFYNNAQVGANQAVNDVAGSHAGILVTGGNKVRNFYAGFPNTLTVGFAGSSNTANASGYKPDVKTYVQNNSPVHKFAYLDIAHGGFATFPNLVNMADLATSNLLIFDQTLDQSTDTAQLEGLIRNAAAAGRRVISIILPAWDHVANDQVDIPLNELAIEQHVALCAVYGVLVADFWAECQDLVPGTYNLSDIYTDIYHPTAQGHSLLSKLVETYLPAGGAINIPLPARQYAASADFQQTPTIKLGTDHDSHTGTWTVTGSSIASVEANATITFSGTFRKFGAFREDDVTNDVTVSIDGGAFAATGLNPNGYDIGTRTAHTIVIKVVTTCTIDEFWAI